MIVECTECESLCGAPTVYEFGVSKLTSVTFPSGELCDECEAFKRGADFVLGIVDSSHGWDGLGDRLSDAIKDGSSCDNKTE